MFGHSQKRRLNEVTYSARVSGCPGTRLTCDVGTFVPHRHDNPSLSAHARLISSFAKYEGSERFCPDILLADNVDIYR